MFYGELGWRYPLNNVLSRHIGSGFRLPQRPGHEGIDIQRHAPNHVAGTYNAIMGEAVFAVHSGTVAVSQWNACAGWWVAIRSDIIDADGSRIVSRYMHLRDRPLVRADVPNPRINQGVQIGNVGNSGDTRGQGPGGRSSGHLHLDFNNGNLLDNIGWATINPQRFFPNINFTGATSNVLR